MAPYPAGQGCGATTGGLPFEGPIPLTAVQRSKHRVAVEQGTDHSSLLANVQEQQRKLLEQLMGPEALGIVQHNISLYDPKLCHPFVAGICPHDLFTNTVSSPALYAVVQGSRAYTWVPPY